MARASFSAVVLIFCISTEIFYIYILYYYVWPRLARVFFSVRVFRPWHVQRARSATVYMHIQIYMILSLIEALKEDGYDYKEDFERFRHVSCRRLGRLLPDARWAWLPFMDFRQRKTDISQVFLKRSCMRVKCFIEMDAGFSPTPSKTDLAHQNAFTTALRNLGNKPPFEKDSGVDIDIKRDGRSLNLTQLDKEYQLWLMEMHEKYDEEVDSRFDEPVLTTSIEILNTRQCRELGIESSLPDEPEIIAVVRPGTYKSGIPSKHLDQKYVMKDNFEMSLVITYSSNKNPQDEHTFYSGRVAPSSLRDFHGLYVFKPRCTPHPLFQNPGIFTFTFSIGDSSCEKRVVKVPVKKASCDVNRWAPAKKISHHNLMQDNKTPMFLYEFNKPMEKLSNP
ncbi:hypothetical protein Hanom_Chr08g00718411 [Helianthus anomalus]